MNKEKRVFNAEVRAIRNEKGEVLVRGYALKFNTLSENLGGFRETIATGAADAVLADDVRALRDHTSHMILGRTKSGTCRIGVDGVGLWYEYDSPDTTYARDLLVSIDRGDVDQSSFQFTIAPKGEEWHEDENGVLIRTITKLGRLYDVSPVTFPAYVDTTVAKRSLESFQEANKPTPEPTPESTPEPDNTWAIEVEARERQIRINQLKINQ